MNEQKNTDGPRGTVSAEEQAEIFRRMKDKWTVPESFFKGTGTEAGILVTGALNAGPGGKE